MTTFALVHGGCHSASCWDLLIPELTLLGHDAITVDLPIDDGSADQREYARVAEAAFSRAKTPLIAVGHSLGAGVVIQLEDRIPLFGMILLTPGIFYSGEQAPSQPQPMLQIPHDMIEPDENGLITFPESVARMIWYNDCTPRQIRIALKGLRPQARAGNPSALPAHRIKTPAVVVRGEHDRTVSPGWTEWAAATLTGKPAVVFPGGHSPFLSRAPELAVKFDALARQFSDPALLAQGPETRHADLSG